MVHKGAGNFMQRAAQIVDTLESFMNSPDDQIEMDHVPNRWKTKLEHSTGMYPFESDGMQNISPRQRYYFSIVHSVLSLPQFCSF